MTRNSCTASGFGAGIARAAQAGGVVAAIELEVDAADLRPLRSVDRGELLGPAERVRVLVAGDAAGDAQQRVEVAVDQRQIQDVVLTDRPRQRRGVGLDERRVADDRDGFRDGAGLDRRRRRARCGRLRARCRSA